MRKNIVGYEGMYQVDTNSKVWSLNYNHTGKEKELKQNLDKDGYLIIVLYKDGIAKNYKVHRLIAGAFVPNPENKPQVNHINGIKTDNRIENLEWVTPSENQIHAYKTGLQISIKGEKHGMSKLKDSDIPEIFRLRKLGWTQQKIANLYGVSRRTIRKILNRKTYTHVEI